MTSKQDVFDFFSVESEEDAQHHMFKYTDCGAWLNFHDWGIEIGSIVEGCDFGTAIYPLRYTDGFTHADIQARIDAVEAESDELWKWANEGPDDTGMTWADIGQDAPDVAREYLHLNPEGRSS